jgi:curved DNA-binding protein CbpA
MSFVNHYAALGLEKSADEAEIKKAFRATALKHHDDKIPQSTLEKERAESRVIFEAASAANEVLTDKAERRNYDRSYDRLRREAQSEQARKNTRKNLRKGGPENENTSHNTSQNTSSTSGPFRAQSSTVPGEKAKQQSKPELCEDSISDSGSANDLASASRADFLGVVYDDLDAMLMDKVELLNINSTIRMSKNSRDFYSEYFPELSISMGGRRDLHATSPLMTAAFASPFSARDLSSSALRNGGHGELRHARQPTFGTPPFAARGDNRSSGQHGGNNRGRELGQRLYDQIDNLKEEMRFYDKPSHDYMNAKPNVGRRNSLVTMSIRL